MPEKLLERERIYVRIYLLFPAVMVAVALVLDRTGIAPVMNLDDFTRRILRISLIVVGLIVSVLPCLQRKQLHIALQRQAFSAEDQELAFLTVALSYCASLAIFGFILFLAGDPLLHAVYAAIASFIGAAAWSYYLVRPKSGAGSQ